MSSKQNIDKFKRDLDTNISKLIDAYRTLLKKSELSSTVGIHEELQVSTATASISFHCQALLDQINELKLQIILSDSTQIDNNNSS